MCLLDRYDAQVDAEQGGQLTGIVTGAVARIARRHGDPVHVGGPQRIDGDGGHQGRVDTARQADHRLGEPVLAQIVPRAEHQRGIDLGFVGQRRPQRGSEHGLGLSGPLGPRLRGNDPGQGAGLTLRGT